MQQKTKQNIVLVIALLSYFLTALSNSLVITGLTKISADLQLNQVTLSWVQNAYGLAFGSLLMLSGRLSDSFSRRSILNIALVIFIIGSLLAGWAPTGLVMITARFLQGIGSAMLAPTSMALLIDYFEGPALVKAIAWYSSIAGLGSSVGLVLGGVLASFWSWRVGFYLNIPICLVMLVGSVMVLEKTSSHPGHFDMLGTFCSVIGCGILVYSLTGAKHIWLTFILAIIILAAFVLVEKRSTNPILPLSIFHSWIRTNAYISRLILNGAVMGYWFLISEYLQRVLHYSPLETGFAYLPMSLTMFLVAVVIPRLITSWGNKRTFLVAAVVVLVSFLMTLVFLNRGYWLSAGIPMIILGVGQGMALTPLTNMGIYDVDAKNNGVASGLVNTAHQLGGVLGLALMVNLSTTLISSGNMIAQFRIAMWVASGLSVIVLVLAMWCRDN